MLVSNIVNDLSRWILSFKKRETLYVPHQRCTTFYSSNVVEFLYVCRTLSSVHCFVRQSYTGLGFSYHRKWLHDLLMWTAMIVWLSVGKGIHLPINSYIYYPCAVEIAVNLISIFKILNLKPIHAYTYKLNGPKKVITILCLYVLQLNL